MQIQEPELPTGMNELTPALNDFIEIFNVNKDLVKSAALRSEKLTPAADLSQEIKKLSREDCNYFLMKLLDGQAHIDRLLRKRLSAILPLMKKKTLQPLRTLQEIVNGADKIKQEVNQKKHEETERERIQKLTELAVRKEQVWKHIDDLINLAKAKYYDEAVNLLVQLKELSIYEGNESAFYQRLERQVFIPYKRKTSLKKMLIYEFNLGEL